MYTQWGRTTCPQNGTDLLYSGKSFAEDRVGRQHIQFLHYKRVHVHPIHISVIEVVRSC